MFQVSRFSRVVYARPPRWKEGSKRKGGGRAVESMEEEERGKEKKTPSDETNGRTDKS